MEALAAQAQDPASEARSTPRPLYQPANSPSFRWVWGGLFWPFYVLARGIPLAAGIMLATAVLMGVQQLFGSERRGDRYAEEILTYHMGLWALIVLVKAAATGAVFVRSLTGRVGAVLAFLPVLFLGILGQAFKHAAAALLLLAAGFLGVGLPVAAVLPEDLTLPSWVVLGLAGLGGLYMGLSFLYAACWMHSTRARVLELKPTASKALKPGLVELEGVARLCEAQGPSGAAGTLIRHDPQVSPVLVAQPFFLEDDGGRILVDPRGCLAGEREEIRLAQREAVLGQNPRQELREGDPVYVLGNWEPARHQEPSGAFVLRPLAPPPGLLFGAFLGRRGGAGAWSRVFDFPPKLFVLTNMLGGDLKKNLFADWRWRAVAAGVFILLSAGILGTAGHFAYEELQRARWQRQVAAAEKEAQADLLSEALRSEHDRTRIAAALGLFQIAQGNPLWEPGFHQAFWNRYSLHDSESLSAPHLADALPTLRAGLLDRHWEVRRLCALALGAIGPSAAEALPDLARTGVQAGRKIFRFPDGYFYDRMVRRAAQAALVRLGAPALTAALERSELEIQAAALLALEKLGPQAGAAAPGLTRLLKEPARPLAAGITEALELDVWPYWKSHEGLWHARVARTLGALGAEAAVAVPALRDKLNDPAPLVRWQALGALKAIGPGAVEAVPDLISRLESKDRMWRREIVETLGALGPAAAPAVPALIGILRGDDPAANSYVYETLGKIGAAAEPALPLLIEQLEGPRPKWDQRNAIEALGRLGVLAREAIPALQRVRRESPDTDIQQAAAQALARIPVPAEAEPAPRRPTPQPPRAYIEVAGRLLFRGKPITEFSGAAPLIRMQESSSSSRMVPVSCAGEHFRAPAQLPGSYRLEVHVNAQPADPTMYPGDYFATEWIYLSPTELQTPRVHSLTVNLSRLLRLVRPEDNAKPLRGLVPPFERTALQSPVRFSWEAMEGKVHYTYTIRTAYADGVHSRAREVAQGGTSHTEVEVNLAPGAYVFQLNAQEEGTSVGQLWTHGMGLESGCPFWVKE